MKQLYINDILIDLSDDTPIALNFAINSLADVKNQNSNTSNQFKIPPTINNRIALGLRDSVGAIENTIYQKNDAKLIQDGVQILVGAFAEVNEITESYIALTVLSGNVDFFDLITQGIYDLYNEFASYEHIWSIDNVLSSQEKTEGWIYPIIDYGTIADNFQTAQVDVRYLRPAFFLHSVLEIISKKTGYKLMGSLIDNPLYKKIIIPFANDNFEHGKAFTNQVDNLSSVAFNSIGQALNQDNGVIAFNNIRSNPSLSYNAVTSKYTAKETISVNVTIKYGIQVRDIFAGGSQPSINIRIIKVSNNVETIMAENEHFATNDAIFLGRSGNLIKYEKQELNQTVALAPNDLIYVQYYLYTGHKRIKGDFYNDSLLIIKNNKTDVSYGQKVQCERIFPDVTQKELIKDLFQRFAIICNADSFKKTITLATFGDLIRNIPIALDWSGKVLDMGKTMYTQIGDYAQNNYLKYKADDNVTTGFGNANIKVNDLTLTFSKVLFESIFGASLNRNYFGGNCVKITKTDPADVTNEFKVNTSPRILIDKKVNLQDIGIKIVLKDATNTREINSIASIPYFASDTLSLDFEYLRLNYYSEFENALKKSKKIIRYFMLDAQDIANLNLLIPIYIRQESSYFYISKIENYIKGKQTKVELIRL